MLYQIQRFVKCLLNYYFRRFTFMYFDIIGIISPSPLAEAGERLSAILYFLV